MTRSCGRRCSRPEHVSACAGATCPSWASHDGDLLQPPGDAALLAVLGVDRADGQGRDRRKGQEDRPDHRDRNERLVEEARVALRERRRVRPQALMAMAPRPG